MVAYNKKLSIELENRLSIWVEALTKAHNYLLSMENMNKFEFDDKDFVKYPIKEKTAFFHKGITINTALLESAIIHFCSLFSSGYTGFMIAGNYEMQTVKLRDELIEKCIFQLNWSKEFYEDFFEKIKLQRDRLLAHYDGNAGEYKIEQKGITSRKMVGAHLSLNEKEQFKELVKTIYENAFIMAKSQ